MKKRNKTFIIFSPAFPINEDDSAWLPSLQTFVMAINKNFPELEVMVFAFQYPYSTKAYTWNNNTIIPFNGFYKGRAARLLMWMKIFNEVRRIKRQYDIIGIFSQWCTECTFIAKYVSKFFKLRYYCWIHGGDARATNTYVKRIRPASSSLIAMSDFLADEFYKRRFIDQKTLKWKWKTPATLVDILAPVVANAIHVLTNVDHTRIKYCPGCDWLFFDHTRNRSRKWCDMEDCGSRDKALRYYHRRKK